MEGGKGGRQEGRGVILTSALRQVHLMEFECLSSIDEQ